VDAYYALTDKDAPTLQELKTAWVPRVSMLRNLAARWGKPILFTEIGYCSKDGANRRPWDWGTPGNVDLQEQADCYRAAFESLYGQPWLSGLFWQDFSTDPFLGSECDPEYTPHNKPAEDVLRTWYGAPPRPTPVPTPLPGQGRSMDIFTDQLSPGWQNWSWDADLDFGATEQVYHGTRAIRVTLRGYGAIDLWHPAFPTSGYQWLEFYIRGSPPAEPRLSVFCFGERGSTLRARSVNDCRYVESGGIGTDAWRRVMIPLTHLDAEGRSLSQIAIQDNSGRASSTFWVDEMRLVGSASALGSGR